MTFDEETVKLILRILQKGNSVELKKEHGQIVIVEVERNKKKTVTIG